MRVGRYEVVWYASDDQHEGNHCRLETDDNDKNGEDVTTRDLDGQLHPALLI
jgi:hypothetical protein